MRSNLPGPLKRGIQSMRPANGIVRESIWTSPVIDMIHHLGRITNNAIQRHHLIVSPFGSSFGTRAVIAYNVNEEGFIQLSHVAYCLNQSPDFIIGLFSKPGEDFHLARQKPFLVGVQTVPSRNFLWARCQLSISRNDPHLLLPRDYLFSQLVPSLIKLAFVLVSPLFRNMMRRVTRACSKVNIEWLVRSKRLLCLYPVNCLVGHVDGKMVFRVVGRFNPCNTIENGRRPLIGLTTNKTVEFVKTGMRGPAVVGS